MIGGDFLLPSNNFVSGSVHFITLVTFILCFTRCLQERHNYDNADPRFMMWNLVYSPDSDNSILTHHSYAQNNTVLHDYPIYIVVMILQGAGEGGGNAVDRDQKVMPTPPPYQCPANQNHVLCQCCLQIFPDRRIERNTNPDLPPQQCECLVYTYTCMYLFWGCIKDCVNC